MLFFRQRRNAEKSTRGRVRGAVAAAVAFALALPAVPLLASAPAQAAIANVTFSNGTVTRGNGDLDANGAITSSNSMLIMKWNPGAFQTNVGRFVIAGFDVAIPEGAAPGDTFDVTLPEFWTVRGASSLVSLTDDKGGVIATVKGTSTSGISKVTFTLTNYVADNENVRGSYAFQAQEMMLAARPAGYHEGPLVGNGTQHILDLKVNVPEAKWPTGLVSLSWNGDTNTPGGRVDLRSRPSWDGSSDVVMTFVAGNGYDIVCDALLNQDPNSEYGIGLADIGATTGSAITGEYLLDPSSYTLECTTDELKITMPASSWTSADAESGQVLRAYFPRVANGEQEWQADDGVYGYLHLEQNGGSWDLSSFNPRPGSSASGGGNQLPPGEFQTTVFQDLNNNNAYNDGLDTLLPGIEVLVEGTTTLGVKFSRVITTDENGFASLELREGDYTATIQNPPAGMSAVAAKAGNDETMDSDYSDGSVSFSIASRQTTKRDAGYRVPMSTILLSKQVTGDASSLVAPDATFTVHYSYPAGDAYEAGGGTVELLADGTPVESGQIPVGAVVTFAEETPAEIQGARWVDPVFSPESVTVAAGTQAAAVTVTNQLDLSYGKFSVLKELSGTGAGTVPVDTVYTVNYSYPAGDAYAAGSGTLEVQADGTAVESEDIPVGAVVSLAEDAPAAVRGTKWEEEKFSQSEVTIGDDETVSVTLTNTINEIIVDDKEKKDEKPKPPVIEHAPTTPGLPVTGGVGTGLLAGAALVLLAGAALFFVVRRRRATAE